MGTTSKALKIVAQGAFYLAILALLVCGSVSTNFSHDENQFIAPGQLLAYHGLFPYVDYPYTHAPYGPFFYAISALASDFDFLAGRVMSCLAWLGCLVLMVGVSRAIRGGDHSPSWKQLVWEFLLVYVFINHGPVLFVLQTALNHSLATLFSLLAAWSFVRGVQSQGMVERAAFLSGVCIATAAWIRLNYASLAAVLLVCWLVGSIWLRLASPRQLLLRYASGVLMASLPAMALIVLAPREFYYGNLVYIRLNTVYYEQLLRRSGMDLVTKLGEFTNNILLQPLELLLYAILICTVVMSVVRLMKYRSAQELARFGIAGIAATLWLSALAPTPVQLHYFAAPLPFLFVLLATFEVRFGRFERAAQVLSVLGVVTAAATSIVFTNPLEQLAVLLKPSDWPPVQVHELAVSLKEEVADGRILTLQPMVPMEAGYNVYAFTATGPFSWRTSLLLTPERRAEYNVTSPKELPALLARSSPEGILIGFEGPNAGFERQDIGGLETPFSEYAIMHGYTAVTLAPPFWPRGLTLWVRP
jgi:hypothetical protein